MQFLEICCNDFRFACLVWLSGLTLWNAKYTANSSIDFCKKTLTHLAWVSCVGSGSMCKALDLNFNGYWITEFKHHSFFLILSTTARDYITVTIYVFCRNINTCNKSFYYKLIILIKFSMFILSCKPCYILNPFTGIRLTFLTKNSRKCWQIDFIIHPFNYKNCKTIKFISLPQDWVKKAFASLVDKISS